MECLLGTTVSLFPSYLESIVPPVRMMWILLLAAIEQTTEKEAKKLLMGHAFLKRAYFLFRAFSAAALISTRVMPYFFINSLAFPLSPKQSRIPTNSCGTG